jgi:hypothetical protein
MPKWLLTLTFAQVKALLPGSVKPPDYVAWLGPHLEARSEVRPVRSSPRGRLGNLDDRELVQAVMAIQRQLDELALIVPDGIWADLDFVESDFTGFAPGEHVEEAAELSAVGGPQAVEDLNGPRRCTGLTRFRE